MNASRSRPAPPSLKGRSRAEQPGSTAGNGPTASGRASGVAPKLAQRVARDIELKVIKAGWPIGEVLGSEPDLLEELNVSRAVLREAIRLLERDNVAYMRRGPGGGLTVTRPHTSAVTRPAAMYLEYLGVSLDELFEAREVIELTATRLATERITEAGIVSLRNVVETEAEHPEDPTARTRDLHLLLAELSGNKAISLFTETLVELTMQRTALRALDPEPPRVNETGLKLSHAAHVAIVDAVVAGDAGLAQHRMRRHLDALREFRRTGGGTAESPRKTSSA